MRVRIVCRRPAHPGGADASAQALHYPQSFVLLPTLTDCSVVAVDDDGVEHALQGITAISWSVEEGGGVATAKLQIAGAELDADAVLAFRDPPATERDER